MCLLAHLHACYGAVSSANGQALHMERVHSAVPSKEL